MGNIKNVLCVLAVAALCVSGLLVGGIFNTAFADGTTKSISDMLSGTDTEAAKAPSEDGGLFGNSSESKSSSGESLIDDIANNMDYSAPEREEIKKFGELVQKIASFIIQGAAYVFTALMVIHKVLDIIYITIPFSRTTLANGYMGNAAAAGTQAQTMNPGMTGGVGMGGYGGGYGGLGGGYGGGFGGGYGGRYGGGYGSMGMGGSMMGASDAQMAAQNQPARGRIQFVSNSALNAVATESVIGPDGKGQSAFKTYSKDMIVSLIAAPTLLVLSITGAIAKIGFGLGSLIADIATKIKF